MSDEVSRCSPTGRRVMAEAARLFAQRGFAATTTRDIAAAVGIRQPSLYKHFTSKEAILAALVDHVSARMSTVADQLAGLPSGPAVRLYRWLHELGVFMLTTPFVVSALLRTRELGDPAFAPQQREVLAGRGHCADLIAGAIAEGVFRPVEPAGAARLVFGVLDAAAIRLSRAPTISQETDAGHTTGPAVRADATPRSGADSRSDTASRPDTAIRADAATRPDIGTATDIGEKVGDVLEFVFRALLADPGTLPALRAEALALALGS